MYISEWEISGNLLTRKSKSGWPKQLAAADLKAERVEDIVDFVSQGGDLAELLTADKEEAGYNLDVLLFINGVLESSGVAGYDKFMENVLLVICLVIILNKPKMIGETYADLSAICYSWFSTVN